MVCGMDTYIFTVPDSDGRQVRVSPDGVWLDLEDGYLAPSYVAAEILRLAERADELENRLADAVQPGEIMSALELGAEIDRLAERVRGGEAEEQRLQKQIVALGELVRELEGIVAMRDGTLDMAVARLMGEVEGEPTHRGNFLQRIDQLRREESDLWAATVTAEEGQEIIGELTAALAILFGENLTPCAGDCPGHLGPKSSAAAREALDRWTAMEAENRAFREIENRALKAGAGQAAEALSLAEEWDRCYPGNVNVESVVNQLVAALRGTCARSAALEAEAERWKSSAIAERDLGNQVREGAEAVGRHCAILEAEAEDLRDENKTLKMACTAQANVVLNAIETPVNLNALAGVSLRLHWAAKGDFSWMTEDARDAETRRIWQGGRPVDPSLAIDHDG